MFLNFKGYLRNFKEFFGILREFKGILRNCHERMPPYFVAKKSYKKRKPLNIWAPSL